MRKIIIMFCLVLYTAYSLAQNKQPKFSVIAFYTAKNDLAHISFVREANKALDKMARAYDFAYDTTSNWNNLNKPFLSGYQLVVFLDTRPELPAQRKAFEDYMETGGAWLGFHFAAFALEKSSFDMNWDWFHNRFLGSGRFVSNTWRPTAAVLKVENKNHPLTAGLPERFRSQPNEWYRWGNDLRKNKDIEILVSIDTASFPLGTGPKANEIWRSGDYPVVWRNRKYRMLYVNMGHNDMDYEHKFDNSNRTLSYTFGNPLQDQLIINAILWLGSRP